MFKGDKKMQKGGFEVHARNFNRSVLKYYSIYFADPFGSFWHCGDLWGPFDCRIGFDASGLRKPIGLLTVEVGISSKSARFPKSLVDWQSPSRCWAHGGTITRWAQILSCSACCVSGTPQVQVPHQLPLRLQAF